MDLQVSAMMAVLFVSVATAFGTALWLLTDPQSTRRRLSQVTGTGENAPTSIGSVLGDEPSALAKRARSLVPKSPKEMNRVQRMMASAGYHGPWPAILFVLVQLALPAITFLTVVSFYGSGTPMIFAGLAALLAYYLPNLWLGRQIENRRTEIRNGLPDAIDLMIVCIEAGSGLDQALARVAEELGIAYPALTKELDMISAEMRAGKPRMEAFKNFAERTKVDDVRSLVAMMVQTDRFGTSLGQALRTHAETSRTKRRQRAEEKAAKLGVKLLFPLVFCLFPAFYLVVLGPSLLRIFRQLVWGGGLGQ
jgi:tight adherence protein C